MNKYKIPAAQSRFAALDELMPLIREQLEQGRKVRFSPQGVSMLPMLRQGVDSVVLSPLPERLEKYDLPLYRRADGRYILHRVVKVGDTYTCMGDNQFVPEPGLEHRQMIALVTSFCRDGREIPVTAPGYRLYCRFWHYSRSLRRFWRRGVNFLRRCLR
ncbi:MAG: S24/S26 family peptidase [Oscillospiraceae bacterium]|nr:S24/S26 family peptidase [Oscillospiraceae bacterium]